jgi:outer membrane protein assembly factor BamB
MKKNTMMLFIAGMVVLALFVPAAMAADYPQNGQFIAHYDEDQLEKDTSSKDAGTTFYNSAAAEKAATLVSTATRSVSPEDWPQFMDDATNAGYSPCDNLPSSNSSVAIFDEYEVPGAINPVIANGYIIIYTGYSGFDEPAGITGINLTCLYEDTLEVKWDFPLPRNVRYGSWASAATDGVYAYGVSDNKVVCVDIATGNEVWTYTTIGSVICNGGPSIGGDYLFCSDWSGNYYCLDKDDGDENWIFNNSVSEDYDIFYSQATPVYENDNGDEYIYVTGYNYGGGEPGVLYKVDVYDGSEVWSVASSGSNYFCGSPSIDANYVYVTSYNFGGDGNLYQYTKDGDFVNSVTIERTDATPAIDEENGLVYVSGGCGVYATPGVRCFYTNNLTQKWGRINEDMGGWTQSMTVADGYVFAGKEYGYSNFCYNTLYALNAETGATEWFYPQGGATAAIANDKIYTVGNDGKLYVFG